MIVNAMDPEEKKRIANDKRLKAVKQWKKNQTVQNIKPINTHKIFNDTINTSNGKKKPKLFDAEDEEDKYEECFKVRPQFEGAHGQELLEMSSQFSGRFKLDERFQEDEPVSQEIRNDEKEKNIKILQSVLGYEVSSDKSLSKKRQIRFDPEDESSSKYVKSSVRPVVEKAKKQKKRNKEIEDDIAEPSVPISKERYVEVSSNLKDILSTPSTPFSLTQNFNQEVLLEATERETINDKYDSYDEVIKLNQPNDEAREEKKEPTLKLGSRYFTPEVKSFSFFVKEGDPCLKEGVEFFKKTKTMEEIRHDWYEKRDFVLELFRRKKRTGAHLYSARTTLKNPTWKRNFKK